MKHAAVSEIVSAIGIIGVFSIATALLLYTFNEQAQDAQYTIEDRFDLGMLKASELLAVSNVACNIQDDLQFILHNYSDDVNISINKTKSVFVNSNNLNIIPYEWCLNKNPPPNKVCYIGFGQDQTDIIWNRTSVIGIAGVACDADDSGFAIITPAKELLVVKSWD